MIAATSVISLAVIAISTALDVKRNRIPNYITFPFLLLGLVFCATDAFRSGDVFTLIIRICSSAAMFLLGMANLIGLGDIKLLMGLFLMNNPIVIWLSLLAATIILILYQLILHPKKTSKRITATLTALSLRVKPVPESKTMIPFAPFLLSGYIIMQGGYLLWLFGIV